MNKVEIILSSCIGLIVFLIIVVYYRKMKEQRQKKIDLQIERVRLASKPGYKPPERIPMRTTVKDGVTTYRKDRRLKKDEEKRGR